MRLHVFKTGNLVTHPRYRDEYEELIIAQIRKICKEGWCIIGVTAKREDRLKVKSTELTLIE